MKKGKDGFYCKYVKRILDIVCAFIALTVFCWLYAIIAVLVRINLGSPVIFKQQRTGKNNKPFILYKFRSLTNDRDAIGMLLPDTERITRFGSLLRSTSLDELPEVFNILKGDMSVIGPRPLPTRYLEYYTKEELCRHNVRPGLSGLAQVTGRSFITWTEKFGRDNEYIKNCSFALDVSVLLSTVKKIIKRGDIMDIGKLEKDENGQYWITVNGELRPVHRPLDIERCGSCIYNTKQ